MSAKNNTIRAVIDELRAAGNTGHVESLLELDEQLAELIEVVRQLTDAIIPLGGTA